MINKINNIYNQTNQMHTNLSQENQLQDITKYSLLQSDDACLEENSKLVKKMQEEIQKCEFIAIKMIKGKDITQKELKFISNKYPEIKETVEEIIKESSKLKDILKNCKNEKEVQQVLSKVIKNINEMVRIGVLPEIKVKLKLVALEECKNEIKRSSQETREVTEIALKIISGKKLNTLESKIINEGHPYIKNILKESMKENDVLREKINLCNNEKEVKKVISKVINDIKSNGEKGILSKLEVKIKLALIEDLQKKFTKERVELKKAIIIAKKIVKGIKLNHNENKLINEKYDDIKQFTKTLLKEYESLKQEIKLCTTNEKKQEVIHNKIEKIKNLDSKELAFEVQESIKREVIDKVKEYERNKYKENDLKLYLNPYLYLLSCGLSSEISSILISIIVVVSILIMIT